MKNHIEEPANIKSVSELAARLEAGEVFYDEAGCKYWFDADERNPFRFTDTSLSGNWSKFASLKTRHECNWWEVEGALPALCVVSDVRKNPAINEYPAIVIGSVDDNGRFISLSGNIKWAYARTATMEEIKQYIKA